MSGTSNARAIVVDAKAQHVPLLGERHLGIVRGEAGWILADSHLMLCALEELGAFAYYHLCQKDLVGESKEGASSYHSLRSRVENVFCHSR